MAQTVGDAQLKPYSVRAAAIGDGQVTSAKIADGAVGGAQISHASIGEDHLTSEVKDKLNAVPGLVDGSVTEAKLDGGVASKLNRGVTDGSVTTPKLADQSVTAAKLADGAVFTAAIAAGAVTVANIQNAAAANGPAILDGDGRLPTAAVPMQAVADSSELKGTYLSLADTPKGLDFHLYHFSAKNLRKTAAAFARVRNGDADMKCLCLGDSTTAGAKASTGSTFVGQKAYPRRVAEMMNAYFIPAAPGLVTPRGTSSAVTADTRWVPGAGWTANGSGLQYIGFGGKGAYFRGTGATAESLVFQDPGVLADTFDVYYRRQPGSASTGSFSVQATGGSAISVDAAAGAAIGIGKVTVAAGSAANMNSVSITGLIPSKTVDIIGVEPSLSTSRKVRVGNAGLSGSTTVDWLTYYQGSSANDYGGLGAVKAYAPDLTIVDLGINDANALAAPVAEYISRLQTIVTTAKMSGDVIIKTMIPSQAPAVAALEAQYVEAVKALGHPVIDQFSRVSPFAAYHAAGMMNSDGLHGTDLGYLDVASVVLEALRGF